MTDNRRSADTFERVFSPADIFKGVWRHMKKITKERLLEQLAAAAFSDYSRFCKVACEGGTQVLEVTDTSLLTRPDRLAVAAVKAGTKGIEVKLYDKLKAVEMLARFTGLFDETSSVDELRELFDEFGAEDRNETD
jgi:hypothetical protein